MVAIEQKTTNKNPRSTVGTVTEISDFLRLLYARASRAYSPVTGEEMVHYTDEQIVELILKEFDGRKIAVTAPIVKGRKGHYRELFESLIKKGYLYARIDGEIREFTPGMKLDRYKIHTIDLVIDRMARRGFPARASAHLAVRSDAAGQRNDGPSMTTKRGRCVTIRAI